MKRTTRAAGILAIAASVSMGAATAVQAEDVDPPSYQEFRAETYQDADRQYIVNGDIPVSSQADLRDFYEKMLGQDNSTNLVVNQVYGQDDVWSASEAQNLTYCVSTKFRGDHDAVAAAMETGAAEWESASSGVDFIHVASEDSNCTTRNRDVLFSVEPVKQANYIARAFFPSSSDRYMNVLVNTSQIFTSGWEPSNIMAHELGHTLGFRHEHTRPEAGTCFEDNSWRPLTPYDSSSIMHYPQCNGSDGSLTMTDWDRQGIQSVYGS